VASAFSCTLPPLAILFTSNRDGNSNGSEKIYTMGWNRGGQDLFGHYGVGSSLPGLGLNTSLRLHLAGVMTNLRNDPTAAARPGDKESAWVARTLPVSGGKHIAFLHTRDGNWRIYVMNANGLTRLLTRQSLPGECPDPSCLLTEQIFFPLPSAISTIYVIERQRQRPRPS